MFRMQLKKKKKKEIAINFLLYSVKLLSSRTAEIRIMPRSPLMKPIIKNSSSIKI